MTGGAGYYGDDAVRQLKAKLDLVALVGDYTSMKASGSNFTACCPFHQERSASFYVYPDQQSYHCFGCGAHGDAITLIREKERLEFTEAVEWLARRAGINLVPSRGATRAPDKAKRERLLSVMQFAVEFYTKQLRSPVGAEALAYLHDRGLSDASIERFGLGWSPGYSSLLTAAKAAGHDAVDLVAVNLATEGNGALRDRFFERVMFPICDRFGQPIAFTARVLAAAEREAKAAGLSIGGKYINSSETALYHKGGTVFNLHRARTAARDQNRLIVMEGPTDVMAADQAGASECVAVCGTALTPEHLTQLARIVGPDGQVICVLDGDEPGQNAARKAIATALAAGVALRVVTIPEGLDVAELLLEEIAV